MNCESLHSGYFNGVLRTWQARTTKIDPDNLIYPLFIHFEPSKLEEIESLPGQYHIGLERLEEYLRPKVEDGLKTVLLFGVIPEKKKNYQGSDSILSTRTNPVYDAISIIKNEFPRLVIACDVCLCGYLSTGYCGVTGSDGFFDYNETLEKLALAATAYAKQGAHIVAPSCKIDGCVSAIDASLRECKIRSRVAIMSYSSKFSSAFYGPFRKAAGSDPGDAELDQLSDSKYRKRGRKLEIFEKRRGYQLPTGSSGLALRAASRDIKEGADIVMVKPGGFFLDVVQLVKSKHPEYPVAAYQVSGEYAMLYHGAKAGAFDLKNIVYESLESFHRAGTDIIISYFTPDILKWLKEDKENEGKRKKDDGDDDDDDSSGSD